MSKTPSDDDRAARDMGADLAAAETDPPDLSIVVTIVEGGATLERCLQAISEQVDPPSLEVLVPYDHISGEAAQLAGRFPAFQIVDLGRVLGGRRPKNAFELHEFFDLRRAAGLKLARGRLIGMVEDRGAPEPDWAASMVALHDGSDYAVVGGAVENGSDRLVNWAVFFCDFARYQPPLFDEDPDFCTDTNICYSREALESVRDLWEERYEEVQVNWALRRHGAKMLLSDKPRTRQIRAPMSLRVLATERFHWGRVFGRARSRESSAFARFVFCLGIPILPLVLFVRCFRQLLQKGRHAKKFVLASPVTMFLLVAWSLGELFGYLEAH